MSSIDLFGRPSTADDGRRNAGDYYETPVWMTQSLMRHHPLVCGWKILEPCAGDGAIARVLAAVGHTVITNDIDPRHPADMHEDAAGLSMWARPELVDLDFVVSNLPFNEAFPILKQALPAVRVGVALLLRKTFLEPTKERGPWLSACPPSRMIGLPRHSFRGSGSDSVSTDWFIWMKDGIRDGGSSIVIDARAKERWLEGA